MGSEADKMHRTNTKYEKIKNVSRDIPAYFVRKMTKEQLIQQFFHTQLILPKHSFPIGEK